MFTFFIVINGVAPSDPCRFQPCRNGATCTSLGDLVDCRCADGFVGELCERSKQELNILYKCLCLHAMLVNLAPVVSYGPPVTSDTK